MTRLLNNMSESRHEACQKPHKYKKLLYALCWFHSVRRNPQPAAPARPACSPCAPSLPPRTPQVLVDRRKFQNLGWNIPYDFNDSDFEVTELCLHDVLYSATHSATHSVLHSVTHRVTPPTCR